MTKPKILIVDDEPFNVDYLEQELNDLEYDTVTACNGQDALDLVHAAAPDLILLDIMMPIMDGFEALQRLKASVSTRDIPIIVISANSDLPSMVHGIELGAEDYLPKPFELTLLKARISSSLEKKRLRDLEHKYLMSLERELDIGRNIQLGFLPSHLPAVNGWVIEAYFKAAREVAGDFYDAFLLPDGNLVCVIGDVCDKGVGAALFMTLFRSLIRVACTMDVIPGGQDANTLSLQERLSNAITFTNNYIFSTHDNSGMFATVFIGAFDIQSGSLVYINCGNDAPLVLREGRVVTALKYTGPAIGVVADASFMVRDYLMQKDDLLLMYTDGVPDARNADRTRFGNQQLFDLLDQTGIDPTRVLEQIERQVHAFIGQAVQYDDITMMTVRKTL